MKEQGWPKTSLKTPKIVAGVNFGDMTPMTIATYGGTKRRSGRGGPDTIDDSLKRRSGQPELAKNGGGQR